MKYCRFLKDDTVKYGMVDGEQVIELVDSFLSGVATPTETVHKLEDVRLTTPVSPAQIVCIGLNYKDHAKEQGKKLPEQPMMFMVSPTAAIADQETIKLADTTHRIDYEAELGIVIGKEAYRVKADEAADYIFGYTIGNDVSDRDYQKLDGQFTRAKSFDTYKPFGPVIETDLKAEDLQVKLTVNGEVRQDGTTRDMIHSVEKIIEVITNCMTLHPGDLILTGTPAGVSPLKDGDHIEITIEGIGTLTNDVTIRK